MKKILSLLLCLGLLGLTAACGQDDEPIPEAVPAPEIVDTETIRADPFAAYFDLSGLHQETLNGAIQNIDASSSNGDVTVHLLQTLSDGHTLYAAFDVTWPQGYDPVSEPVEAQLTLEGATQSGMITGSQTDEVTGSYIVSFSGDFAYGQVPELILSILGFQHVFNWTVENTCPEKTVSMEDSEGTVVGQTTLTPFSLSFHIDSPYISGIVHGDTIQLLDESGTPLPETWNISGDPSAAFLEFFVPMNFGTVKTLQVGPYTAHF